MSRQIYRILINIAAPGEPVVYVAAPGAGMFAAYSHEGALELRCQDASWHPPVPGERYDYAVRETIGGSIKLFTIDPTRDPTPGYTISTV
jgi:hypothetical protein